MQANTLNKPTREQLKAQLFAKPSQKLIANRFKQDTQAAPCKGPGKCSGRCGAR